MKEIGYLNFKDMRKSSLYIIISLLFCNLSCTEYLDVKNKGEVIPETAEEFSALLHRHLYSIDGAGEYAFFGAPSTAASYEAYTDNWDADLTTKLICRFTWGVILVVCRSVLNRCTRLFVIVIS